MNCRGSSLELATGNMASWADIVEMEEQAAKAVNTKPAFEPEIANFCEDTEKTKLFLDILAVHTSLKNIEEAMDSADTEEELAELGSEHDQLSDMVDFLSWQFGNLVGYDDLAGLRKIWGIQTSMHNVLQERYYKAQKARYEHCKRVVGYFSPSDRSFIEQNKLLNELHMEARWKASHCREIISSIIEAAFPNAPFDLGWDENWVEA